MSWPGPEVSDYDWRRYVAAGYEVIEAEKAAHPFFFDGRLNWDALTRLENAWRVWLSFARKIKGPAETIKKAERILLKIKRWKQEGR